MKLPIDNLEDALCILVMFGFDVDMEAYQFDMEGRMEKLVGDRRYLRFKRRPMRAEGGWLLERWYEAVVQAAQTLTKRYTDDYLINGKVRRKPKEDL